jgi:hypothetical protein
VKTRVLDSRAILEWIVGRKPAADAVAALLSEAEDDRATLLMSAVNAGEVYQGWLPNRLRGRFRRRSLAQIRVSTHDRRPGVSHGGSVTTRLDRQKRQLSFQAPVAASSESS